MADTSSIQSKSTYADRWQASYGEAFKALGDRYFSGQNNSLLAGLKIYVSAHPVRAASLVGVSALAMGYSVFSWGVLITGAQGLGLAALILAREAATFKDHRHILAVASASTALATIQQGLTAMLTHDPGHYIPGMVMLGHATATLAAFSVIPEAKKAFRRAVTWGGGLAGCFAAAYTSHKYGDAMGFIPAITTLGNAILFSMSDSNTPRARLGYIGMNISHLAYWATQPVMSVSLAAAEALYLSTHMASLRHHDVPVRDRNSHAPLSAFKQVKGYLRVIFKGERAQDIGVTQGENPDYHRLDSRFYAPLKKLIFGA